MTDGWLQRWLLMARGWWPEVVGYWSLAADGLFMVVAGRWSLMGGMCMIAAACLGVIAVTVVLLI